MRKNLYVRLLGTAQLTRLAMAVGAIGDVWFTVLFSRGIGEYPYLDVVLEAFGPGRMMYGSDWPVCRLAAEYGPMKAIVDDHLADLAPDEQASLWGGTAARVYGLEEI